MRRRRGKEAEIHQVLPEISWSTDQFPPIMFDFDCPASNVGHIHDGCGPGPPWQVLLGLRTKIVHSIAHLVRDCGRRQSPRCKSARDALLSGFLNHPLHSHFTQSERVPNSPRHWPIGVINSSVDVGENVWHASVERVVRCSAVHAEQGVSRKDGFAQPEGKRDAGKDPFLSKLRVELVQHVPHESTSSFYESRMLASRPNDGLDALAREVLSGLPSLGQRCFAVQDEFPHRPM